MFIIIGVLVLLLILVVLVVFFSPKSTSKDKNLVLPNEECCGGHEVCDIDLTKLSEDIIYFEDEELDVFSQKDSNSYSYGEIEEFREVLYTLKQHEINDWLHSLELRKIEIPEILKPEVFMILAEYKNSL